MPELPEVETVRRGLEPTLAGRRILWARAHRPDLRWPLPERFAERLSGAFVRALRRRSKYLLIDLERASGPAETWIAHLGMSGRFVVSEPGGDFLPGGFALGPRRPEGLDPAHIHLSLETEAGRISYFDPRRFGAMDLWPTETLEAHPTMARLGPEPLSNGFSVAGLAAGLAGRRGPIKALLLDQRIVAGLGNIYVCEALWRAAIGPARAGRTLAEAEVMALVSAVKRVLEEAIASGGSSLRDYRQADGALGYFQHAFAVYGRAGAPCRREGCDGVVERIAQAGRSTFYCPSCQR